MAPILLSPTPAPTGRRPQIVAMALSTSRSAARLPQHALRACSRAIAAPASSRPAAAVVASRPFSTSPAALSETAEAPASGSLPRWAQTPERMKAPFSPHITKDPARSRWKVNEDPKKLDRALFQFLGPEGERLLPDELKWLAVTHKSFDQGRRGFNDRLAFLGSFKSFVAFAATGTIRPCSFAGHKSYFVQR